LLYWKDEARTIACGFFLILFEFLWPMQAIFSMTSFRKRRYWWNDFNGDQNVTFLWAIPCIHRLHLNRIPNSRESRKRHFHRLVWPRFASCFKWRNVITTRWKCQDLRNRAEWMAPSDVDSVRFW
jgi:hypothetical protein